MPAALLAFILFKEPVTAPRLTAIATGVAAIGLFSWPSRKSAATFVFSLAIWLTVTASLLRAGMGLSYKAGLLNGANEYGLLVINGIVWMIGGIICHFVVDQKKWRISPATLAYGALSGVLVCGIVLFMMLALKYGDAGAYPGEMLQILCGDMNSDRCSPAIKSFLAAGWKDSYYEYHKVEEPGFTYHGFQGRSFNGKPLDRN